MKFSFTLDKSMAVIQRVKQVFPMLTRIMAIILTDENYHLTSFNSKDYEHDSGVPDKNLLDFFSRIKEYEWWLEKEIPFVLTEDNISRNLFEELNRNVLVIRDATDPAPLFIFLYFHKNKKHFGILKNDDTFSHENREIIAQITFNNIKAFSKYRKSDLNILSHIRQSIEGMALQQSTGKKGQKNDVRLLEDMIVEMASEYLVNIGREQNAEIALSPDAREKIAAFRGSPSVLRKMLYQASLLAMNIESGDRQIIIEEWQLLSVKESEVEKEAKAPLIQHRHLKTYQLLDRLENAVKNVLASNLNVTGANVGKSMTPPISAPAISDAMKKHRSKIISLMQDFPERWTSLRNHFKPLQNVLITPKQKETLSA